MHVFTNVCYEHTISYTLTQDSSIFSSPGRDTLSCFCTSRLSISASFSSFRIATVFLPSWSSFSAAFSLLCRSFDSARASSILLANAALDWLAIRCCSSASLWSFSRRSCDLKYVSFATKSFSHFYLCIFQLCHQLFNQTIFLFTEKVSRLEAFQFLRRLGNFLLEHL